MDTLTLPVEGWALAYPNPRHDLAHLVHTPCGWRSQQQLATGDELMPWHCDQLMDEHECGEGGA